MIANQFQLVNLLNNVDGGGSGTSSSFSIKQITGFAVQHVWSAGSVSRAGVITLSGGLTSDGTFTAIDTFTIDGNSGSRLINISSPMYPYIQVSYSPAGDGGGSVSSNVVTKLS